MIKNLIKHQKIKASLVVPFLALLFITSLVTVAFYQIRVANANQYRLLRDTYRLKIMLELTTQNLESHLEVKDNEMIFPTRMDFSTGNVEIKWDEKSKILISGDTLFRRSYGRYDLPTGDLNMLCNSLEKLSKLPEETVVYNGHTDETTIGEEKIFLGRVGIL